MSIDFSQHWAAGGATPPRQHIERGAERAQISEVGSSEVHGHSSRDRSSDDSFGFGDFLDIVNPLHHLPVVGTIYRDITGDEIKPVSRVLGAGVFGGPIGLASGVASAMIEETTGNDPMGHLYSAVTGRETGQGSGQSAPPQVAERPNDSEAHPRGGTESVANDTTPSTSGSPIQHWAAAETGILEQTAASSAVGAIAGDREPRRQHWAGSGAPNDQEQLAAAPKDAAGTGQTTGDPDGRQETVTFFSLGPSGAGPRTATINRPDRPESAPERAQGTGNTQNPASAPAGAIPNAPAGALPNAPAGAAPNAPASAASAVPPAGQSNGRMNDEAEAVMRAMTMGLEAMGSDLVNQEGDSPAAEQPASPQSTAPNQAADQPARSESAPQARGESGESGPSPTGSPEDIASAMTRALDRYQAMDRSDGA